MLAALDPAPALSGAPGLDHETVARIIEVGEDHLTDVDAEAGSLRRVSRIDRNAPSTDLGLARPAGGTLVWGIFGGAVQGQPRVALEILKLARARHHPEIKLTLPELDLDAADPRRAVLAQGRQRLVFADGKPVRNLTGERRFGRRKLGPARHQPAPNQRWRIGTRQRSVTKMSTRRAMA